MSYDVNFVKSEFGNAILGGKELIVRVKGAEFISGGIYKDNLPVQVDFEMGKSIQFKLAKRKRGIFGWRTVPLKKGRYTLKIRAYVSGRGQGWDDEFYVL